MQGKRMQGESAKQVALDVLRKAHKPLHSNEVAKRVIGSGRCSGLKGKTPEATISAMLAVGSKTGGPFKRVEKGTYTLIDEAAAPKATAKPAQGEAKAEHAEAKPAPKRTSRKRRTAKATA